jgi:hypothetical protein
MHLPGVESRSTARCQSSEQPGLALIIGLEVRGMSAAMLRVVLRRAVTHMLLPLLGYFPVRGEVIQVLPYHPVILDLWQWGYLEPIPDELPTIVHPLTGRKFVDATTCTSYARQYDHYQRAIPDRERESARLFYTAVPTREEQAPPRRRGAPQRTIWRTWSLDQIITLLSDERRRLRLRKPGYEPNITEIIQATCYPRETIRNGLKQYNHTPTSVLPLLHD